MVGRDLGEPGVLGGGVHMRGLRARRWGVATCIVSPRLEGRETADTSVTGGGFGTLLASGTAGGGIAMGPMVGRDLGGVSTCEPCVLGGGVATCIVSPRLEGRETADTSMTGGGRGTLLASGIAGGRIAMGRMVSRALGRGAAGGVGVSMLPPGLEGRLRALRFGRGGTFGGGGGAMPGPTFGRSSWTPTTLCASEMLADSPKCLPTRHSRVFGFKELNASAKSLGVLRASKTHVASGSTART